LELSRRFKISFGLILSAAAHGQITVTPTVVTATAATLTCSLTNVPPASDVSVACIGKGVSYGPPWVWHFVNGQDQSGYQVLDGNAVNFSASFSNNVMHWFMSIQPNGGAITRRDGTFGALAPLTATAKGPNQINLTWPPVPNPGYGYLVEVHSSADPRYQNFTEIQPIPWVRGFTCDPSVIINGASCTASDPGFVNVYNPPSNGVPYWVTDATYQDPQDGSAAQFIVWGLLPGTAYEFRFRPYSALGGLGPYSAIASATTAAYQVRYVSPSGSDSADGLTPGTAWRSLAFGSSQITCGQVLMVAKGSYGPDTVGMNQACSPAAKAVIRAEAGAVLASVTPGASHAVSISGASCVLDGLKISFGANLGDYDVAVGGSHNALLGLDVSAAVVPTTKGGVNVLGSSILIYASALHDYGSPDGNQNPGGNNGFPLAVQNSTGDVIWSNHLSRGGHDVSLCIRSCVANRWLNNVMDGGWGMGLEAIQGSTGNLLEGSYIYHVGRGVPFYKPGVEISSAGNVVRRNVVVGSQSWSFEISALYGGDTVHGVSVYNNTGYQNAGWIFGSANGGLAAYDGVLVADNISFAEGTATDIYQGNTTGQITFNSLATVDGAGAVDPAARVVIWNHAAGGDFQYPKTVDFADTNYAPPWSNNAPLVVDPLFVAVAANDYHLRAGSPMIGAGVLVVDSVWPSVSLSNDVGAFAAAGAGVRVLSRVPLPAR